MSSEKTVTVEELLNGFPGAKFGVLSETDKKRLIANPVEMIPVKERGVVRIKLADGGYLNLHVVIEK